MVIKKLLILALSIINLKAMSTELVALEEIYSTLTNLSAKAEELNKIKESEYKKYYRDLRIAISRSLLNTKIDTKEFNKLSETSAKRTAHYVLEQLFKEAKTYGAYKIYNTSSKPIGNFEFKHTKYTELNVPFDTVVNQILLISRSVEHLVKNYKRDEDISILSLNTFNSIFYTFFAQALFEERKMSPDQPASGKLHLTILSNTFDEKDLETIEELIADANATIRHYSKLVNLTDNKLAFDIYLSTNNTQTTKPSAIEITKEINNKNKKFALFSKLPTSRQAIAFVRNDMAENERNLLFDKYIQENLMVNKNFSEAEIEEYKFSEVILPYFDLSYIMYLTKDLEKENIHLFILDNDDSLLFDIPLLGSISLIDLLYLLQLVMDPRFTKKTDTFKYNYTLEQFEPYDNSRMKKTNVMKIKW